MQSSSVAGEVSRNTGYVRAPPGARCPCGGPAAAVTRARGLQLAAVAMPQLLCTRARTGEQTNVIIDVLRGAGAAHTHHSAPVA